jgi:hypothetical protein
MLILAFHPRLGLPSGFFPSGIPILLSPHTCYTPRPYHSSWSDGPTNICELYTLCSSSQLSTFPCYHVPRKPKYLPQHLFSNTTSLCSSSTRETKFNTRTRGKIIIPCILTFIFLDGRLEDKRQGSQLKY